LERAGTRDVSAPLSDRGPTSLPPMSRSKPRKIPTQCSPFLLSVRVSKIDGYGVFAGKVIPLGHKVMIYAGEKLTFAEALERTWILWKRNPKRRTYFARLNRNCLIDGAVGGNGAECINHCCDPNVYFRRVNGKIFVYSKRRILKGEELTLDYRFPEDREKIPCHCGYPNCRGYMNRRLRPMASAYSL
jgi:uncharacterized protein